MARSHFQRLPERNPLWDAPTFLLILFSGGPTYCALASIFLADRGDQLTESEVRQTVRWVIMNQEPCGGFGGRTCKDADACYNFWCGASLAVRISHSL